MALPFYHRIKGELVLTFNLGCPTTEKVTGVSLTPKGLLEIRKHAQSAQFVVTTAVSKDVRVDPTRLGLVVKSGDPYRIVHKNLMSISQ